jgi:hypothetical protein
MKMMIKTRDKFAKQDNLRVRLPYKDVDKLDYVGYGKVFDIIIRQHDSIDLIIDINIDPEVGRNSS